MVLIKTSAGISGINGKLQGSYFRDNGAGLIMSNHPIYGKTPSQLQQFVRITNFQLSQNWRAMSESNRQSWQYFPYMNEKGMSAFMKSNFFLQYFCQPICHFAPVYEYVPDTTITNIVYDPIGHQINIFHSYTPTQSLTYHFIFYSQNPFIVINNTNTFRMMGLSLTTAPGTDSLSSSTYEKTFGTSPSGLFSYPCQLSVLNINTGQTRKIGTFQYHN